ncbi:helix-turn-helix domain-containing protein [Lysobacter enzymogenes]|nr:helix-turn-helix domain-containing protein [Lysobacter enzymogenes]
MSEPTTPPLDFDRLLRSSELADRWQLAECTVRKWRSKNVGPGYIKIGRSIRYHPDEVHRYEQAINERRAVP